MAAGAARLASASQPEGRNKLRMRALDVQRGILCRCPDIPDAAGEI
jgi:hypothetical protein